MTIHAEDITAVILAGGQGRRMGGQDKGLLEFNRRPLVRILIEKLEAQGLNILINANRNLARYREFGYPVASDRLGQYQGPLAGFASAMAAVETEFILTLPCDGPLLAEDYAGRFIDSHTRRASSIHVAHDGERLQPVHALIRTGLRTSLDQFLADGGRKIDRWYARQNYATVDFSACADMFRNINTPQDRQALEAGL